MAQKKLGVLVSATPEHGGVYQYTLSILKALCSQKELSVTVYATKNVAPLYASKFPVVVIQRYIVNKFLLVIQYWLRLSSPNIWANEDVLFAPTYTPLLLNTRTPFIYTLHDLQERYYPEYFSLPQRIWRNYIHSKLSQKSLMISCESEYVKNDIVRFFSVPEDKISVIAVPPLILSNTETSDVELSVEGVRKEFQFHEKYIFYPAQFWPHKNHLRLLEAFKLLRQEFPLLRLVLTGKKRDEFQKVMAKVEELNLTEFVTHVGYVEQFELDAIYRQAEVVVMPTLFESISIPVYEAFNAGVPVCASNVVALPEQVGEAGLLFDPFSVSSMVEALGLILRDSNLREKLIQEGKKKINELSHKNCGDAFCEMLRKCKGI